LTQKITTKLPFAEKLVLGVTGTRKGATETQLQILRHFLYFFGPDEAHHGDALGVDSQFHDAVRECLSDCFIVVHPPTNPKYRAFNEGDLILPEKAYLTRDDDIILASDLMIGVPFEFDEQLRSGTWATIRHTRNFKKPLIIIYPDGMLEKERLLPFHGKYVKMLLNRMISKGV
jgi:hypothetical protein